MAQAPTPYVLGPGDGEPRWSFGTLTAVKASGALTGERFALVEERAPRGDGAPLHRHPDDDESFYVLDGEIALTIRDAPAAVAGAGSFVHIPGGVAHAFGVASEAARYLIFTTPTTAGSTRRSATLTPPLPRHLRQSPTGSASWRPARPSASRSSSIPRTSNPGRPAREPCPWLAADYACDIQT